MLIHSLSVPALPKLSLMPQQLCSHFLEELKYFLVLISETFNSNLHYELVIWLLWHGEFLFHSTLISSCPTLEADLWVPTLSKSSPTSLFRFPNAASQPWLTFYPVTDVFVNSSHFCPWTFETLSRPPHSSKLACQTPSFFSCKSWRLLGHLTILKISGQWFLISIFSFCLFVPWSKLPQLHDTKSSRCLILLRPLQVLFALVRTAPCVYVSYCKGPEARLVS